jgi:AcrR family transcriptional regulator
MTAARARAPLSRDAIIDAARELITTAGLEALSLRRLAARLDVTAPALYAHVEDKRDLLRTLAEGEFDRLVARFDAVHVADPVARIRAHGRAYIEHAREEPELFRIMFLFPPDLGGGETPEGEELPGATKAFTLAAAAVAEAVESGAIEAVDPLVAALTIWSGVHGVASVLQLGFGLPAELEETLIDEISDRLLRGFGAT